MNDSRSLFDATSADTVVSVPFAPAVDYYEHPALSRSDLGLFDESRRLYEAIKETKLLPPRESSDALDIGSATHAHILEPERFLQDFTIWCGKPTKGKKAKKAWNPSREGPEWKAWQAWCRSMKKEILTIRQYCDVITMGLLTRMRLQKWIGIETAQLAEGVTLKVFREHEIYWTADGVYDGKDDAPTPCRCKIDYLVVKYLNGVAVAAWILDVKTAQDGTRRTFKNNSREHRYWLQVPHYSCGVAAEFKIKMASISFIFVVIDKGVCGKIAGRVHDRIKPLAENPNIDHKELATQVQASICAELTNQAGVGVSKLAVKYMKLSPEDHIEAGSKHRQMLNDLAKCRRTGNWADAGEDDVMEVQGALSL